MTDRLIVRVGLRGGTVEQAGRIPQEAVAEGKRRALSKPARPWVVGGAVVVGLSIVLTAALTMEFPGGRSTQDSIAESRAPTNERGSVQTGGDRSTDTAALPLEPAARPVPARESVSEKVPPRREASDVESGTVAKPPPAAPEKRVEPNRRDTAGDVAGKDVTAPAPVRASAGPQETEARPAAPVIADPRVVRTELSAGIRAKEPTVRLRPPIRVTGRESRTIYFFSEVRDFGGQTLFHRWERDGNVVASIPFEVRGKRWRIYSQKTLTPRMTGRWRVVLADSAGKELARTAFEVR